MKILPNRSNNHDSTISRKITFPAKWRSVIQWQLSEWNLTEITLNLKVK